MRTDPALPRDPIAFLFHFVRRRPALTAALLLTVMSGAGAAVAGQYALKLLIDAMVAGHAARGAIYGPLGLLLGLLLAEGLLWRAGGWLGSRLIVGLSTDIRARLFADLLGRPWRFFHTRQSGALSGRIGAAGQAATSAIGTIVWNLVPPAADLVGSVAVLTLVDWRLATVLAGAAAAMSFVLQRAGRRGFPVHNACYEASARVLGEIGDVLTNVMLVKCFGGARRERARLERQMVHEARLHRRSWMFMERLRLLYDLGFWVISAALLLVSAEAWRAGRITAGDVVVVMTLSLRILNGSRELALSWLGLARQLGAVTEAVRVLAPSPPEPATQPASEPAQPAPFAAGAGELRFHAIAYAPDGRHVLFDGLALHIPAGQSIGIVGPSGAGKSTLLRLLQGLVLPDAGAILIDGRPIVEIAEADLAGAIAPVTQEVELFHRSIRENLCYGTPDASFADMEQAARAAGCDGFIRALPGGYEAIVGERGVMLSGGQRQRLALARALLRRAPVLLLDEATSALDSASELIVQSALLDRAGSRTIVAVAHRLSTVMAFDRVIVLDRGAIVEDGNPRALRHAGGRFARMWEEQSRVAELAEAPAA